MKYCKNCVQHNYIVEFIDIFLNRHKRAQSLKRDGLHLSRTGIKEVTARLEEKLQSQCPFQKPQKGPVQEERGVGQEINPPSIETHRKVEYINRGPTWQWKQCKVLSSELSLTDLKKQKGLKIVHLNIRSLFKKKDSLEYDLLDGSTDILGLSETWLKDKIPNSTRCIVNKSSFMRAIKSSYWESYKTINTS